ncbi:MAG TPA: hypothetical protein LFW14_07345 [Rickettsia endosymbiont of Degeeriella rufa]|nr:hypothetical protein [Rickettsia endosymbiont of Columbicola hoogstraali]HJD63331.1 hypothetical protein [Rickettsia endosymbiont of Degeeriella rufa]
MASVDNFYLAIATSVISVGVGLCDSPKVSFSNLQCNSMIRDIIAASTTILPAYIVTILIPNAFITVLGFAGMILVIIAILLPAYLLYKAKIKNFYYPELKKKYLIVTSVIMGIFIMGYELTNTIIGIL